MNKEPEKSFGLTIYFDKKERSVINGLDSFGATSVIVSEEIKDLIINQFVKMETVISFELSGITRHINTRNILYIDVVSVDDVPLGDLEKEEGEINEEKIIH